MAHKKGQGSSRNGRDSNAQRLGVKRFGGQLVGVHHLEGHLAAAELADPDLGLPYLGLVVSGGHTALYRVTDAGPPAILGETRDDAVGEAFDNADRVASVERGIGLDVEMGVQRLAVAWEPDRRMST